MPAHSRASRCSLLAGAPLDMATRQRGCAFKPPQDDVRRWPCICTRQPTGHAWLALSRRASCSGTQYARLMSSLTIEVLDVRSSSEQSAGTLGPGIAHEQVSRVSAAVGRDVRHAAISGEWLVLLSPDGELTIWTLCSAALMPRDPGAAGPMGGAGSNAREAQPKTASSCKSSRGLSGSACALQPVAGWRLKGAKDAVGLRLLSVPPATGRTAHMLCVVVQLAGGEGLCVRTPLPVPDWLPGICSS